MVIRLGDINFGIGADTQEMRTALKLMATFGDRVDKVARSQAKGARATEQALRKQERAIINALQQTERLKQSITRVGASSKLIEEAERAFRLYTNQLNKGQVKALTFQRANERLQATLNKVTRETQSYSNSQRAAASASKEAARAIKQEEAALEASRIKTKLAADAARELQRTRARTTALNTGGNAAVANLDAQFARADKVREYGRALERAGIAGQVASRRTREYSRALNELHRAQEKANRGARRYNGVLRDTLLIAASASGPLGFFVAQVAAVSDAMSNAGILSNRAAIGFGAATVGIAAMGGAMIRAAFAIDRARSQFVAITGDVTVSNMLLREAQQIADISGQSFTRLAGQYARFNAAAQNTALQGAQTRDIFVTLSKVIGQLQLPAEQAEGVLRAVEQIMSKGKVQAEELRNQLGDRLPGAFQIAARAVGVNTAQLSKMLEQGEILSDDFLPKFAAELERTFNTNREIDNMTASINRLGNSSTIFLNTLDTSLGVSTGFKNAIDAAASALDFMTRNIGTLLPAVAALGTAFLALRINALIVGFSSFAAVIGGVVATGIRTAATAMTALNAALLANPITGIVSVLWRLVAAIGAATAGWFGMKAIIDDTSDSISVLNQQTNAFLRSSQKIGTVGGVGANLMRQWNEEANDASMKVMELRSEVDKLQNSSTRNFLSSFTPVRGVDDAKADLIRQEARAKRAFEMVRKVRTEANRKQVISTPTINSPVIKGGGRTRRIGSSNNAARALAQRQREEAQRARELEQQSRALGKANQEFGRMDAELHALQAGGIPALEKLHAEFKKEDVLARYGEKLKEAGLSQAEMNERLKEYSLIYDKHKQILGQQEQELAVAREMEQAYSQAFDRIGDSISDMVANGRADFQSFQNILREVLADLVKTSLKMQVINPLKKELLGGEDGGGGGIFASIKGFLGLGGEEVVKGSSGSGGSAEGGSITTSDASSVPQPVDSKLARGGVINTTSIFNSSLGRTMAGEAGSEAVMPLRRNSRGQLGVIAEGGSARPININIQTPDPKAFHASRAQVGATIRRALGAGAKNGG